MDQLEKKERKTSRGFHYSYYVSPDSQADSSKPAILLCHGWPDSANLWQYVVPHLLKTRNKLVIPDLLGAGDSAKPTDPASFQIKAMVEDVMEILDAENISHKIVPVGHDWGSYFAQRFYMLHKPRMSGVVTLNVAWSGPQDGPFDLDRYNAITTQAVGYPIYAYWELLADPHVGEVTDPHLESLWYALHGDQDEWMKRLFCVPGAIRKFLLEDRKDVPLKPYAQDAALKKQWLEEKGKAGLTSQCAWYRAWKEGHHVHTESSLDATLSTPYLFIACDGDAVCRPEFIHRSTQAGLVRKEDLTLKELHSGHWCPYERPVEVAAAIVEWLEGNKF